MTPDRLVLLVLAALIAAYLFVMLFVTARRRRDRRKARNVASLRRKHNAAWTRLRNSAAGAP